MVIGDPIEHSLSPEMHNAGYKKLQIDTEYVYVACHVKVSDLSDFIKGVRAMNIRGVSCTIPHKMEIMKYLDKVDSVAKKIGAVNTIVNANGVLKGYNTDWIGIVTPLEKVISLQNKTIVLLGAGGAARAVAYAITKKKAKLIIYNRTFEKAKQLAKEFGGEALEPNAFEKIKRADVIINTTAIGLHPQENETPLPKELLTKNHIVFDIVYTPGGTTKFLKEARKKGAKIIVGTEMLLHQGTAQFTLFTGYDAPVDAMRKVLEK